VTRVCVARLGRRKRPRILDQGPVPRCNDHVASAFIRVYGRTVAGRTLALVRWPSGGLWQHGDFLRLWSGQTISAFGSQVSALALPLIAISILKVSTFEVAALSTVEFVPFTLFSLPAGVWVDRLARRPILIVCDWGRALALATIPLTYWVGALTIWQLYLVGFVVGTLTVFFDIAYQSYLPSLVQRDQIPEGNAKLTASSSGAAVGGPGLAGVLIAATTAPFAVFLDAVSFIVSALFVTRIGRREEVVGRQEERRSMWHEIKEGLRYVFKHPYMRPALIFVAISNFFTNGLFALVIVYAVRKLHLSPAEIGLSFSLGNAGWLVGAVTATRISTRFGIGPTLVGAAALGGWGFLLIPLAPTSMAILFISVALFVFGVCAVVTNIVAISLSQAVTPDRLLGRMTASRRFAVFGVIPLGSLTAGALGSSLGLHTAIWICAIGASVAFLPMLLSPVRSVRTLEDAKHSLGLIHDQIPA
jgi:MFS family permease